MGFAEHSIICVTGGGGQQVDGMWALTQKDDIKDIYEKFGGY